MVNLKYFLFQAFNIPRCSDNDIIENRQNQPECVCTVFPKRFDRSIQVKSAVENVAHTCLGKGGVDAMIHAIESSRKRHSLKIYISK